MLVRVQADHFLRTKWQMELCIGAAVLLTSCILTLSGAARSDLLLYGISTAIFEQYVLHVPMIFWCLLAPFAAQPPLQFLREWEIWKTGERNYRCYRSNREFIGMAILVTSLIIYAGPSIMLLLGLVLHTVIEASKKPDSYSSSAKG
ncbi:MAG TPA: hypothetical protein VHF05_03550 [Candidatus Paceibacterota bacterium]|jgi:hypothetical protein|nr:hypothetical protein [Candidatus Paceibacterota bacterium]